MKKTVLIFLACLPFMLWAQEGITFEVEKLEPPKNLLSVTTQNNIFERLILSDVNLAPYELEKENLDFPFNIVAQSQAPDSLTTYGYNSFFNGMYQAYADHRPFVLSPDMIWLLISQGFARHVNANPEKLRHHFVDFSGKLSLIVQTNKISLDNPDSPWEEIFPEFTKQISDHVGKDFAELLTCNFSTTTSIEKIASEITIMEATKPYFDFVVMRVVCGIPEITLKGTPEDWEKVLEKTRKLRQYDLGWWIWEIQYVLKEFIKASKGDINKTYWQNMFKCHSQKQYGAPDIIDGWIVKFFPYDKKGKRNNLMKLEGTDSLPDEIVKVDLDFIEASNDTITTIPLELWAGFIGLEQNKDNFALTPKIGWMIRKKDVDHKGLKQKFESGATSNRVIDIRVKEFPAELLSLEKIKRINIKFINYIRIPDEFAKVEVEYMQLSGKITMGEIIRIRKLFPNTEVTINRVKASLAVGTE